MTELDRFISVDVETAGPEPTGYSLLSIGAGLVSDPERAFTSSCGRSTSTSIGWSRR